MEIDKSASVDLMGAVEQKPPLRRAPTLYLIILFKLGKGILAVFLAVVLYFEPANNIPAEYEQLISRPAVKQVFHYLRIHPENKFFTRLALHIANVTQAGVRDAAIGALLWSLFPLTEGVGLIFRVPWAGWLAIGESAFFVPVEIYELLKEFSWFMVVVAIINIGIVWYLYANRERLFHHHRPHRQALQA
ncbi:MAG: DUF2127 domain-containing protein [Limisphaerales bacterium]